TISILRGLKDRYEQHHGVRITDSALVAAAMLSHRYITDRYLPDKAIDLIDEAAARLKMQVDSKPEELDSIDREVVRLKIEQEALRKESDPGSKERLKRLEKELAALEKRSADLTARWKAEKDKLSDAQKLKTELDHLRVELANAQRKGEYQRAGELAYGRIPEIEKKLKNIEAAEGKGAMVEEAVTADHVAQVVSRWTGVPVERMLEGEKEKLLRMEEQLGKRVTGQAEAVKAVSTAVRRARAGLQGLVGCSRTEGQGDPVGFRNTLIGRASNLGSEYLANQPEGQDSDAVRDQVMAVVRANCRPESLNRIDEIILFHRLKRSDMTK